jgi:uncharacterized protein
MKPTSKTFAERYGPWAVVTGASAGIGKACAVELARRGLSLVLVARRELELRALADALRSGGADTRVVVADLATAEGVAEVERTTADLDVGLLVAAAGFGTSGALLESDPDGEKCMLDLNCGAILRQSGHFGRRFVKRGRGGMILFGSIVGFQGVSWTAHYAATKAYVQSLGEALHLELAPRGVDVLVAAPGPVHSEFAARARMTMAAADRPQDVAREIIAALGRGMTVTPGKIGKLLTWSLKTAPRSWRIRIISKIMAGMTRTH